MKEIRNKTFSRILIFLLAISTTVSLSGISSYAASSDTTVYITKTGKCYHNSGCSSLSKSCIETTLGEASGKYSPCSKCKPPVLDSDSNTSSTTTKAASTSKASTSTKETTKSSTKNSTSSSKNSKSSSKSSTSSTKSSSSKSNKTTSKASTSKQTSSSTETKSKQTASSTDTTEKTVWVPTNGGTKYHSKSSCSNMKDPVQISLDDAESKGYTPCKKCH